jgi:hypothetical protein
VEEKVNEIYIGDKDPYHYIMYDGKGVLMQLLYGTLLDVFENDLDEKIAVRIHCYFSNRQKSMDFVVYRESIEDTIDKVFEWALENEEYEWCSKLKSIKKELQNENFSYRR